MILPAYYDCLRRLLGSGDTDKQITHVGFGSDATAPAQTDTALSSDAVLVPVLSVDYPSSDDRLLTIHFELGRTEGNGLVIRETGLLTADGTLVARKVRDEPIPKTPDMRLGESWDLLV